MSLERTAGDDVYPLGPPLDAVPAHRLRSPAPFLLTMDQAANHLQVSRSSLYREVARGRLHVVKVGHLTRIRLEDLEAYVSGLAAPTR